MVRYRHIQVSIIQILDSWLRSVFKYFLIQRILRERCEGFEFSLIFRLTKRLQAEVSSTAASEAKAQ